LKRRRFAGLLQSAGSRHTRSDRTGGGTGIYTGGDDDTNTTVFAYANFNSAANTHSAANRHTTAFPHHSNSDDHTGSHCKSIGN